MNFSKKEKNEFKEEKDFEQEFGAVDIDNIKVVEPDEMKEYKEPQYVSLAKEGNKIRGLYIGIFPMVWYGSETPMLLFKQKDNSLQYCRGSYNILKFLVSNKITDHIFLEIERTSDIELSGNRKLADFVFRYDSAKKLSGLNFMSLGSSKAYNLIPESLHPKDVEKEDNPL